MAAAAGGSSSGDGVGSNLGAFQPHSFASSTRSSLDQHPQGLPERQGAQWCTLQNPLDQVSTQLRLSESRGAQRQPRMSRGAPRGRAFPPSVPKFDDFMSPCLCWVQ